MREQSQTELSWGQQKSPVHGVLSPCLQQACTRTVSDLLQCICHSCMVHMQADLMIACTWSNLGPSGGLGTLHPTTLQSAGRLETTSLAHTSTNTPKINLWAEDIARLFLLTEQLLHVTFRQGHVWLYIHYASIVAKYYTSNTVQNY